MKFKTFLLTAAFATAITPIAMAQTPPVAPPGAVIAAAGPPIPGVCVFDQDELVATSLVGKAVKARMQQIVDQTAAEIQTQQTQIETERTALTAKVTASGEAAMTAEINAFNDKVQTHANFRDQRAQEVEKTTDDALTRIFQEASPLMEQAYVAKTCSILFDANATAGYNASMNITPYVVQLLDAKIQSFTIDRASLDNPPAATPAATPARPAAR